MHGNPMSSWDSGNVISQNGNAVNIGRKNPPKDNEGTAIGAQGPKESNEEHLFYLYHIDNHIQIYIFLYICTSICIYVNIKE